MKIIESTNIFWIFKGLSYPWGQGLKKIDKALNFFFNEQAEKSGKYYNNSKIFFYLLWVFLKTLASEGRKASLVQRMVNFEFLKFIYLF